MQAEGKEVKSWGKVPKEFGDAWFMLLKFLGESETLENFDDLCLLYKLRIWGSFLNIKIILRCVEDVPNWLSLSMLPQFLTPKLLTILFNTSQRKILQNDQFPKFMAENHPNKNLHRCCGGCRGCSVSHWPCWGKLNVHLGPLDENLGYWWDIAGINWYTGNDLKRPDIIWVFPRNRGTLKSSILIGFSIMNHPFWGFSPYIWKHPYIFISCFTFFQMVSNFQLMVFHRN